MSDNQPFIFDAHLDLAMNAMEWNRDLRWSIDALRKSEEGIDFKPDRGKNTVSFEELRNGNIGIVVATQIARYTKKGNDLPGASWNSPEQAWAMTQAQLAWYKAMETDGQMTQLLTNEDIEGHLKNWENDPANTPLGFILSLEGADSIIDMSYLERAYAYGLRAIGPAHYGPGTYAFGTDSSGGIGTKGKELLKEMDRLNMILDATHLCDQSFWEALDVFKGPVWASHNNCRSLVEHNRQFSDDQIKVLIERGAVIGSAFDAWMLVSGWERGVSQPQSMNVNLEKVIDNMDHICQIAGNPDHIGIGSDLDGGFGQEQCPYDLETIADLQKLSPLLANRGFTSEEIEGVFSGNWLRFLRKSL